MSNRPRDDARSLVGRLYDSYGASLYRYAVMLLGDPAGAEDAIHQVFAAILRQTPRLDDEAHYLRRAVRNECYSQLRRRQTQGGHGSADAILEPVTADIAPEERLALEAAIRELPPEQREVIALHVFEGWTFQQIAGATDTSINTVSARYRYALAKLRQILK
jgi:RNA polymerase sigma factor (sigma-70 family)